MKRAALALAILLMATSARSDGIFNPGGRGINSFEGPLNGGAHGPTILLSNNTIPATASIGTTIGTFSVINGTGTYTYSLTSNPGTLFSISGSSLQVAAALSAGSDPITVQANNGAGSTPTQPFTIIVTGIQSEPVPFVL